jgi:hypothetical protein
MKDNLTPQEKEIQIFFGLLAASFSKFMLEKNGFNCDYKINGEPIAQIIGLNEPDIAERLKLAVFEERFEDAAKLKKLLDQKKLKT